MGRKKILEKRLQRLQAKKANLASRAKASTDAEEVRSINAELEDLNAEIEETQEEINAIKEEGAMDPTPGEGGEGEQRSAVPQNATLVNGNVVGTYRQPTNPTQRRENENPLESLEYR